jgi:hypothetical protein
MRRSIVLLIALIVVVAASSAVIFQFTPAASGTLAIGLTDAPTQDVSHIYLTISNIELELDGNTTETYSQENTQFDLLALVNVTKMLGNVSVPAGNYTMIRLNVASALATIDGANVTLKVPSGEIKVPNHFQIQSGKTTTIILDITADNTNISASGNLRPIVTVKSAKGPV